MNKDYLLGHWYAYIYDQNEVGLAEVERILSYLGNEPKRILEVACGTGRISIPLAQAGHNVTGFDIDEHTIARITKKVGTLPNLNCFKADALVDDWGCSFDAVILAGTVLHNIVTDGDYAQAQELFIKKAASCVKPGGHMFINFDCIGEEGFGEEGFGEQKGDVRVIFEGTDDLGTHGKYIAIGGEYDKETRISRDSRRYEIIPKDGEKFVVERPIQKHFPSYEMVTSWLNKYGWTIERQNPASKNTFHAEIWAKKQ